MKRIFTTSSLPLIVLGVVIVSLRLVFVFVLPFGQTVSHRLEGLNDEPAHCNYVKYLAEHRSFPVFRESYQENGAFARAEFEYFQPPLYYLACSALYRLKSDLYLLRMTSFICGILSLLLVWHIMLHLGTQRHVASCATAFLGLLPTHVYFNSVVSNDPLCWLISLAVVNYTLRILLWKNDAELKRRAVHSGGVIGFLLAVGLLTKASILLLYPIVSLTFILQAVRIKNPAILWGCLIAIGGSLLLASPWYLRNLQVYGSLLAVDSGFGPPRSGHADLFQAGTIIRSTVKYFWFPMQHIPPSLPRMLLNAFGLLIIAVHTILAIKFFVKKENRTVQAILLIFLLLLAVCAQFRINLTWSEPEARHIFPALASIIWILCVPVFAFFKRWEWGHKAVFAGLLCCAMYPYAYLLIT